MPRWTATGRHVVAHLTGPAPDGKPMWYPRYLTYHLLPEMIEHDWLERLTHVFLIRDPAAVVASYLDRRGTVSAAKIGVPQQACLYDYVRDELGQDPPVIDSGDFLHDPEAHLRALCDRPGHAGLAAGPARQRWCLGAALV